MTDLREALERVMDWIKEEERLCGRGGGEWADAYRSLRSAAVDALRTHGPALLEAVRDAERYRWLKSNGIIRVLPIASGMMSRGGTRILADTKDWLPGDFTYVIDGVTKDVDAAIDAAMQPRVPVGGEG